MLQESLGSQPFRHDQPAQKTCHEPEHVCRLKPHRTYLQQLKDFQICPADLERLHSDDGFAEVPTAMLTNSALTLLQCGNKGHTSTAQQSSEAMVMPASIGFPSGCNTGARFSVLVMGSSFHQVGQGWGGGSSSSSGTSIASNSSNTSPRCCDPGCAGLTISGCEVDGADGDFAKLRDAFVAGVCAVASVPPIRVRVLDIGPPLELGHQRRPREAVHEALQPSGKQKGCRPEPDTGKGILKFLECDSDYGGDDPGSANCTSSVEACDATSISDSSRARGGVTRVLAVIRESPRIEETTEEPSAMVALQRVVAALGDPDSILQERLKPWTGSSFAQLGTHTTNPLARQSQPNGSLGGFGAAGARRRVVAVSGSNPAFALPPPPLLSETASVGGLSKRSV